MINKEPILLLSHTVLLFYADLTLSFLGNESGLISSFLSSEELGELLDKVRTSIINLYNNGNFQFCKLMTIKYDFMLYNVDKHFFEGVHGKKALSGV